MIDVKRNRTRPPRGRALENSARENDNDSFEEIELAPSVGRFREAVLASVGLDVGSDDEDGCVVTKAHRGGREKSNNKRNNGASVSADQGDYDSEIEGDEEEELIGGITIDHEHEPSDPPPENESSWQASLNRILNKIFWIIIVIAAVVYIFHEDDSLEESGTSTEENVLPKKQPYSYKGYKDARIPDDDIAQFGGGIVGAKVFGISSADGDGDDDKDELKDELQSKQSGYHKSSGIVQVDSLWEALDGYAEMAEPFDPDRDLPVFWHVPKSGGTTLQDLLVHCLGMVAANEVGAAYASDAGPLEVVTLENGNRVVNVDMSNPAGISRAGELGFAHSDMADVVLTSWFGPSAAVFDAERRGR